MMDPRISQILKKNKKEKSFPFSVEGLSPASVLVLLHEVEDQLSVLLTKRSHEVLHHKGQVCFPGGVSDAGDNDLWQTALRESQEEIGIEGRCVTYLGELKPLVTPSGFLVHPYVGFTEWKGPWKPNPREIAEIFSVPIAHFVQPENFRLVRRHYSLPDNSIIPGELKNYFARGYDDPLFTFGPHEIWGATGRILVELLEVVRQLG